MNEQLVISNEQFKNKIYKIILLIAHCSLLIILSCTRNDETPTSISLEPAKALPSAILQTGEHPIWFQLTERGPVYLETIEDAVETTAFSPWPWAVHVRSFYERDDEFVMAVNRDGFMAIMPFKGNVEGLAFYHFTGGEYWKNYSIGGFTYYEEPGGEQKPVILLYLDNRFLDLNTPLPNPRTWTYNMDSNSVSGISIPALDAFPQDDGWDVDTLRLSSDGFWYYRVKKNEAQGEIKMLKTANLSQAGISINIEDFFNSSGQVTPVNDPAMPALPALPSGFIYTGIGRVGDSIVAIWEEQNDYSIGAAGFMVVKEQIIDYR